MAGFSRRNFLALTGSAAMARLAGRANAAMGPNDKFDLVIKGGDVLDPSQKLRGKRDIGIRYGMIEAVEADIPADARLRVPRRPGKLVTPGLIDLHSHVYPYGSAIGIPADELVAIQGTTTRSRPATPAPTTSRRFRRYIVGAVAHAALCLRAHRQHRARRLPGRRALQHRLRADRGRAKALAENADIVLGVKVRMSENVIAKHGLEPLKRAHPGLRDVGRPAPR